MYDFINGILQNRFTKYGQNERIGLRYLLIHPLVECQGSIYRFIQLIGALTLLKVFRLSNNVFNESRWTEH